MQYKTVLQEVDLKSTNARLAVLSYLDFMKKPLTVDEIVSHIQEEHESVDRATIYRILDAFYKKGLVKRLEFSEGKFRYELSGSDHHHLICEQCGNIEDILDCGVSELESQIKAKKKFAVKRHSLEFYGVCASCQN